MLFTRYNAKDTSVVVDGVHITGLGEDMISIEKEEALAENVVGAQGDVVRSEINNSIYNVTVTVQATSPQREFLMSLKDRTEAFPVWVINKPMHIRAGGTMAMVTEVPAVALGATVEDMEFTFTVYDGVIVAEAE